MMRLKLGLIALIAVLLTGCSGGKPPVSPDTRRDLGLQVDTIKVPDRWNYIRNISVYRFNTGVTCYVLDTPQGASMSCLQEPS